MQTTRLSTSRMSHTCLIPSSRASLQFGRYSFPVPMRVRSWVGLRGWLRYRGGIPARRRSPIPILTGLDVQGTVTSLIWILWLQKLENNATVLRRGSVMSANGRSGWLTCNMFCSRQSLMKLAPVRNVCELVITGWAKKKWYLSYNVIYVREVSLFLAHPVYQWWKFSALALTFRLCIRY